MEEWSERQITHLRNLRAPGFLLSPTHTISSRRARSRLRSRARERAQGQPQYSKKIQALRQASQGVLADRRRIGLSPYKPLKKPP
jgi:hypothetical protein